VDSTTRKVGCDMTEQTRAALPVWMALVKQK
jgi:hypothetical protein